MTTPSSLQRLALGDLDHELASTRRVLERVPEERFAWQPHARSMSIGSLANHVVGLTGWLSTILTTDELDVSGARPVPPPESRAALLSAFDAAVEKLQATLAQTDDERLRGSWTLRNGEHVIVSLPRLAVLRTVGVSHIVHHRAQIGVYLRLLDVPVPGLYGPSADEKQ